MRKPKAKPTCSIAVKEDHLVVLITGSKDAKTAAHVIMTFWYKALPANRWRLKAGLPAQGNDPISLARVFTQEGYDVDVEM